MVPEKPAMLPGLKLGVRVVPERAVAVIRIDPAPVMGLVNEGELLFGYISVKPPPLIVAVPVPTPPGIVLTCNVPALIVVPPL